MNMTIWDYMSQGTLFTSETINTLAIRKGEAVCEILKLISHQKKGKKSDLSGISNKNRFMLNIVLASMRTFKTGKKDKRKLPVYKT